MRGKALFLGILFLSVLSGCGSGHEVEVPARIRPATAGGRATGASPVESIPSLTEIDPTRTEIAPAGGQEPPVSQPATEPLATAKPLATDGEFIFDPGLLAESLTALRSFRQKAVLDFSADDPGIYSRATYEGEVTTEPAALHSILRIEGQAPAHLPGNQVEAIWIGEQVWVKMGRKPWIQAPVTAIEREYGGQVVGVGDLMPLVQGARRVLHDETVNGIPCEHYVYDIENLAAESGMTSAQGDIWLAEEGDYVVRLTMNGQGTYYGIFRDGGRLELVYDLFDVGAPISIEPPR
jgi:hypothetical protein